MPTTFAIDQEVYVPNSAIGLDPSTPTGPFYKTRVRHIKQGGRSVKVDIPPLPLTVSKWVGTSKIVLNLGVLIIRIGDYKEHELLDPLCKSVLYFCRMLTPGNLQVIEIRTAAELLHFWTRIHTHFEQVILIGHGDRKHIYFGDQAMTAADMVKLLEEPNPTPKEYISLCCQTGKQPFGKPFSNSSACSAFVAPFHSVHGVTASQFCQAYLTRRLLEGRSIGIAFNQACEVVQDAANFHLWQSGSQKVPQQ